MASGRAASRLGPARQGGGRRSWTHLEPCQDTSECFEVLIRPSFVRVSWCWWCDKRSRDSDGVDNDGGADEKGGGVGAHKTEAKVMQELVWQSCVVLAVNRDTVSTQPNR